MPADIEKQYPHFWTKESEEGSKNKFESDLIEAQLRRHRIGVKYNYHKIIKTQEAKQIEQKLDELLESDLNVLVYLLKGQSHIHLRTVTCQSPQEIIHQ